MKLLNLAPLQILGIVALAALILGGSLGYKLGAGRWHGRYTALQAEGWREKAQAEEAARKAVEQQLSDSREISQRNAETLHDLQIETRTIDADRAHLRRLLDAATRSSARCDSLPEAPSEPGAHEGAEDSGDGVFAALAEGAISECRANTERYRALIDQLRPQL